MKSLILIPSDFERELYEQLVALAPKETHSQEVVVRVCGVGMVASALGALRLILQHTPDRVFLIGIAGGLSSQVKLGDSVVATSVLQHGIGIGEGASYKSAEEAGFHRFNKEQSLQTSDRIPIPDVRPLQSGSDCHSDGRAVGEFLTVASASTSRKIASERRTRFPDAILEDMETYSVALSCGMVAVDLVAIRGISNEAGDRNFDNWDSSRAIEAAVERLQDYFP